MTPRVAVVIPCYNDGRFLEEALESLRREEPHELVVINDGSKDPATLDVLAHLEQQGTAVLHQDNAGLAGARMAGVAATTAAYVHTVDADDRMAPGALTRLADALDANPHAAAAWGAYHTFGASDCRFPTAPLLDPWRVTYFNEITANTMLRREAIEAVGGWDGGIGYEDWDFWMKLAEHGASGIGIPQVTFLYREHARPRMYTEMLRTHNHHFEVLRQRHAPLFGARRENRRSSPSPVSLKLAVSAIDSVPGLSSFRKRQLWGMARYLLQREMCSDCYRGPIGRLRDALYPRRRGLPSPL